MKKQLMQAVNIGSQSQCMLHYSFILLVQRAKPLPRPLWTTQLHERETPNSTAVQILWLCITDAGGQLAGRLPLPLPAGGSPCLQSGPNFLHTLLLHALSLSQSLIPLPHAMSFSISNLGIQLPRWNYLTSSISCLLGAALLGFILILIK